MSYSRFKARLRHFYTIFIAPPKRLRKPKKCDILIYDLCGAETLTQYMTRYSVEVIPLRGEFVNITCLLRAFLKRSFWEGKPIQAYVDVFINIAEPKIVITFIDNSSGFYTVSSRFPAIKTILLQNGTRDNWLDGLINKDVYHVDYMLVHNMKIGEYYRKFISGCVVVIGSLKSNGVKKSAKAKSGTILFISQYQSDFEKIAPFWVALDGTEYSPKQFYMADEKAIKFLGKWCVENDKFLQIGARSFDREGAEKRFYDECLKGCMWEYIPRSDNYSSYQEVDEAEIVVSIDSTLGYESIGRGKKTAVFSCRGNFLNTESRKFGWPAALPDNGPFWTNDAEEKQFYRVMDYLNAVSNADWEEIRQQCASEIMLFDLDNIRFVSLLDQLLSKSNNVIQADSHI